MRGAVWVLVIGILLVALANLAVFVVLPALRRGRGPVADPDRPPPRRESPAGAMLSGFGYVYAPHRRGRRQDSVSSRVDRAIARIDAVDPYAAQRRIGEALTQVGLLDTPPPPTTTDLPTRMPE